MVATLPKGTPVRLLRAFLDEQQDWIHQTLDQLHPQRQEIERERNVVPTQLKLLAIDRTIQIQYRETCSNRVRLTDKEEELVLSGRIQETDHVHRALGRYIRHLAKRHLATELHRLSQAHHLSYGGLSIRRQKTRWGSCSASGRINLNDKLLFLPRPLMQHVLLHELAHTRYMDHSAAFYKLLQTLDPEARANHQALQQAGSYVPHWVKWA